MGEAVKKIFHIMNASNKKDDAIKKKYHVKGYQRGYRWDTYQVNCLIEDTYINYKKYYKELKDNTSKMRGYEYCLQPLVINKEESVDENVEIYSVIDGQQRLTTLSLIFKVLNRFRLIKKISGCDKADEIAISYDRDETETVLKDISEICKEIEGISVKKLSHSALYDIFSNKSNIDGVDKQEIANINEVVDRAGRDRNIDGQFMVNAYCFIYLYFKAIIEGPATSDSMFGFTIEDYDEDTDYSDVLINTLVNLFKYNTTIIWYEPLLGQNTDGDGDREDDKRTEEDVFEKFNADKIPLNKSELTKALFMNPDNYIKEGCEGNLEAIKTRQILIGNKWDEIETRLHNEEIWNFFPHYDKWHKQTRFDAVIDLFVYTNLKNMGETDETKIRNDFTDKRYSYKMIDKWIRTELAVAKDSSDKANIMKKWWNDICDVYDRFIVYLEADEQCVKMFHRISLIRWMEDVYFSKVTRRSVEEKYFNQLKVSADIIKILKESGIGDAKKKLNEMIEKRIRKFYETPDISKTFVSEDGTVSFVRDEKNDDMSKMIKAMVYNSSNMLLQTFLIIFNLQTLEKNKGSISRFSFYSYSKEKWILEHIFARKTSLKRDNQDEKKILEDIIGSGWKEYLEYKFDNILSTTDIKKIVDCKQQMADMMQDMINKDDIKQEIYNTTDEYTADHISYTDGYNCLLVSFLKDNSMGNMSLLTVNDNTSVSNDTLEDKKDTVFTKIKEGKFVPIGTVNTFMGAYCEKGYSAEIWYPCHRKKYLEELIDGVNAFFVEA